MYFLPYHSRLQAIAISDGIQQNPIKLWALGYSWTRASLLHSHWLCQDWVSRISARKSVQCLTAKHCGSIWNALCLQVSVQNWEWGALHGHGSYHEGKTWQPRNLGYVSRKESILWLSDLQWSLLPLHLPSLGAASEIHRTLNDPLKYPFRPSS